MARIKALAAAPVNKEGEVIDPTVRTGGGDGRAFNIVEPDYYLAVVDELEYGTYHASWKGHKNPNHPEGKWEYAKLTPTLILLNENKTRVMFQDVVMGVITEEGFIRPDGDKSKSAIWPSAQFFLAALGALRKGADNQVEIDIDPGLVRDRIVKVRTALGGYIKGVKTFDAVQFAQLLAETYGSTDYTFEDVGQIVDDYNVQNGYVSPDGKDVIEGRRLIAKNLVTNYYGVDQARAEEEGFFFDQMTGAVFVDATSFNEYQDALLNEAEPF